MIDTLAGALVDHIGVGLRPCRRAEEAEAAMRSRSTSLDMLPPGSDNDRDAAKNRRAQLCANCGADGGQEVERKTNLQPRSARLEIVNSSASRGPDRMAPAKKMAATGCVAADRSGGASVRLRLLLLDSADSLTSSPVRWPSTSAASALRHSWNNPETVNGTAVPASMLLSMSALLKVATSVLPSADVETEMASNRTFDKGALIVTLAP